MKMISWEMGAELARSFGIGFYETSVITGHNVEEAFMYLARLGKENIESNQVGII